MKKALLLISAVAVSTTNAFAYSTFNPDYIRTQIGLSIGKSINQASQFNIAVSHPAQTGILSNVPLNYNQSVKLKNNNLNGAIDLAVLYQSINPIISYGVAFHLENLDITKFTKDDDLLPILASTPQKNVLYSVNSSVINFKGIGFSVGPIVQANFRNHTFLNGSFYPFIQAEAGVKYVRIETSGLYSFNASKVSSSTVMEHFSYPFNIDYAGGSLRPYMSGSFGIRNESFYFAVGLTSNSYQIQRSGKQLTLNQTYKNVTPGYSKINVKSSTKLTDTNMTFSFGLFF